MSHDNLHASTHSSGGTDPVTVSAAVQDYTKVTGSIRMTVPRIGPAWANGAVLTSARLYLTPITLYADEVVTSITFFSGATALDTATNQWFGLFDSSRVPLRLTNDATSAAWGTNTLKTLNLSSTYPVTTSGLYFLGICVVASTVPTLQSMSLSSVQGGNASIGIVPIINGNSSTGLTDPASCPNPAGAISQSGLFPVAWVS